MTGPTWTVSVGSPSAVRSKLSQSKWRIRIEVNARRTIRRDRRQRHGV
jgi:hypothetical protein